MEIRYACPSCGAGNGLPVAAGGGFDPEPPCRSCGRRLALASPPPAPADRPLSRCLVCGEDKLFVQKDFNQKLGCGLVLVGAVLVPWTYGLSLAVFALIDYLLYRRLPMIPVCYVCGAKHRGFEFAEGLAPYELITAQTYEARAIHWRRSRDRSDGAAGESGGASRIDSGEQTP